jgi:hypothetical protein
MAELDVRRPGKGVRVRVKVKPRARKTAVLGVREGVLEVAVAATPTDGRANAELVKALARALQIAPSRVSIVAGGSGRSKLVEFAGLSGAELVEKLGT